jgi:hypothetical protein
MFAVDMDSAMAKVRLAHPVHASVDGLVSTANSDARRKVE